jgi:hypothetical protein
MSNHTANASHYGHTTRRMAESQPATPAQTARITLLLTTRATFDHLFTDAAERISVTHKIASDWTDIHGLTTPSLDYLVERLTAQIEIKRAQLLQDGDEFTEPTYREIQ